MAGQTYDSNNIFAKILRGEVPCHKVYEDAATFVFMDIMPRTDGHALVIPKMPARNILDASPQILTPLIQTTQRVAKAAMKAFGADGVAISQFSEPASGQEVFHLHVHVLPRYEGVEMRRPGIRADDAILVQHAEKLKAALNTQDA